MDSDVLNLVVLPLLGGYIFYSKFHGTSFAAKCAEGQRLIYSSSVIGVLLLIAARLITKALDAAATYPQVGKIAYSIGLVCVLAGSFTASLLLLCFCRRKDLRKVRGAMPRTATGAAFTLSAAAAALMFPAYELTAGAVLRLIGMTMVLLAAVILLTPWVIRTSRLHYPTIVARLSLLWLSLWSGYMLILVHGPAVAEFWPQVSTIQYSGTALVALGLGAIAWIPFNVVLTEKWAWHRAHRSRKTTGLEHLLFNAFSNAGFVQITLKDGKVYVGFLLDMPAPKARANGDFIEFVPLRSGYREQPGKRIITTTNYAKVIKRMTDEAKKSPDFRAALDSPLASMTKVVPISEVLTASRFSEKYSDADFALPAPRERRESKQPAVRPPESNKPTTENA